MHIPQDFIIGVVVGVAAMAFVEYKILRVVRGVLRRIL